MPDYIYLLENRLSADQQNALRALREVAREAELILFLTGDAVRDLTSGHAVRDLEVAVQGNALKLKKAIQKAGGKLWGEDEASRSLYLCFPGTVRVDVVSTHTVEYKKPGQPIYHPAGIQEDLRRRDFTANAMAISLNEGSYGLLMDPLNGVADIETRTIRLVSNYGFIEDPSLLIRAVRYRTRLGWELDPRTQTRYENSREEGAIEHLSAHSKSRELEQIGHEAEGLKVLQALEAEGWMKVLCAAWTSSKADVARLNALHDFSVDLLMQGVHADISAAQMQLLTAKMSPKDLSSLKKSLLRPGFVEEWDSLDALAAGFAKVLQAKENQTPSAMYKLFTSYDPEAVLWLGFTSKDAGIKQRYQNFLKVWPEMRQQIPYALMQEMRIRPELPNYNDIVHAIFLQLIDGKLTTPEEMRAFLEPYSPPAPPPAVTIKRTRAKRVAEPKVKEVFDDEEEGDEDLDDMGGDEDEDMGLPKLDLESDGEEAEEEEADDDEDEEEAAPRRGGKGAAPGKGKAAKTAAAPAAAKASAAKGAAAVPPAKHAAPAKHAEPVKHAEPAKHAAPVKHAEPAKHAAHAGDGKHAPAAKHAAKAAAAKPTPAKASPKASKPAAKAAPAKHAAPKAAAHKAAAHKSASKAPVKKATLKPAHKPAHKAVPKAASPKASKPAASKAKVAKPKAKPAPKPAAKVKAKPHKPAKPVAKKPAAKPAKAPKKK